MYKAEYNIFAQRGTQMQRYRISTGTVTYAIKGRDILRQHGYSAAIERLSGAGRIGCGYGIVFGGDPEKAEKLLRASAVKIYEIKQIN